jgi:hypothetical protein
MLANRSEHTKIERSRYTPAPPWSNPKASPVRNPAFNACTTTLAGRSPSDNTTNNFNTIPKRHRSARSPRRSRAFARLLPFTSYDSQFTIADSGKW